MCNERGVRAVRVERCSCSACDGCGMHVRAESINRLLCCKLGCFQLHQFAAVLTLPKGQHAKTVEEAPGRSLQACRQPGFSHPGGNLPSNLRSKKRHSHFISCVLLIYTGHSTLLVALQSRKHCRHLTQQNRRRCVTSAYVAPQMQRNLSVISKLPVVSTRCGCSVREQPGAMQGGQNCGGRAHSGSTQCLSWRSPRRQTACGRAPPRMRTTTHARKGASCLHLVMLQVTCCGSPH